MHPEIRQIGPGSCPICGMALEPLTLSADATGPNPELARHDAALLDRRRARRPGGRPGNGRASSGLDLHHYVPPQISVWLQFVLATPVVLWAGWPFFVRGWASVRNRSLNMFSADRARHRRRLSLQPRRDLRAAAVSRQACAQDGIVPVYYEAAAVITVLVLLGQVLELRAREKTGGAIRALLEPRAEDARGASATTAATKRCRSSRCISATACACAPAKACRSTAS